MTVAVYSNQEPAQMARQLVEALPADLATQAKLIGVGSRELLRCLSPNPPAAGSFRERQIDVLWMMQQVVTVLAPYLTGVQLVSWLLREHPLLDGRAPLGLVSNETRDSYLNLLHWIVETGAREVTQDA